MRFIKNVNIFIRKDKFLPEYPVLFSYVLLYIVEKMLLYINKRCLNEKGDKK